MDASSWRCRSHCEARPPYCRPRNRRRRRELHRCPQLCRRGTDTQAPSRSKGSCNLTTVVAAGGMAGTTVSVGAAFGCGRTPRSNGLLLLGSATSCGSEGAVTGPLSPALPPKKSGVAGVLPRVLDVPRKVGSEAYATSTIGQVRRRLRDATAPRQAVVCNQIAHGLANLTEGNWQM